MKRRRGFWRWLRERLESVVDEVTAGLIILAITAIIGGISYLTAQMLPVLFTKPVLFAGIGTIVIVVVTAIAVMIWRGRKRFVRRSYRTLEEERDIVLKRLFTGQAVHLETFERLLDAEKLERYIVAIHGVGGVGKSWLLRMYRLMCIERGIAVALVSGDEERSALNVLRKFGKELEGQGGHLGAFAEKLEHYKRIQAKVQEKTMGWSALAQVGVEAGKAVPVVGPAIGVLGSEGVEQLIGLLRTILSQDEIDLYLTPEAALTDLFLDDLAEVSESRRLVLMFDAYEQMTALDAWMHKFVVRLSANVLVVIAGRGPLSFAWRDLRPMIEEIELKEMSAAEAKECLEKSYLEYSKRPLDAPTAERLAQFGRGLPLALSSAAYIVAQYGAEEFEAREKEIIADLVEVMTREAGKEWLEVLEACGVVRWFTQDTLRAILGRDDVALLYGELRQFPFVRPGSEGLVLHDRVWDWINEDLRGRSPDWYRELNERAAKWYETRVLRLEESGEKPGLAWQRCAVEWVYHQLQVNEDTAIALATEFFEDALLYACFDFCQALLVETEEVAISPSNRSRMDYCHANLAWYQQNWPVSRKLYERVLDCATDPLLRGSALSGLARVNRVQNELLESIKRYEEAAVILRNLDAPQRLTRVLIELGIAYRHRGLWPEADVCYEEALQIAEKGHDQYNIGSALMNRGNLYRTIGSLAKAEESLTRALKVFRLIGSKVAIGVAMRHLGHLYIDQGRIADAVEILRDSREILQELGDIYYVGRSSLFLGHALALSGRFNEAEKSYTESRRIFERLGAEPAIGELEFHYGFFLSMQGKTSEALSCHEASLAKLKEHFLRARVLVSLCSAYEAQGSHFKILPLSEEAERLSKQYSYWDQLALLRVVQGNLSADGSTLAASDTERVALLLDVFDKYSKAMTYALRYNRYMLDEVLEQIIAKCKERAAEGRAMLEQLAEFWRTESFEGKSVVELEKEGRERERGDGRPQTSVLERLQAALEQSTLRDAA